MSMVEFISAQDRARSSDETLDLLAGGLARAQTMLVSLRMSGERRESCITLLAAQCDAVAREARRLHLLDQVPTDA